MDLKNIIGRLKSSAILLKSRKVEISLFTACAGVGLIISGLLSLPNIISAVSLTLAWVFGTAGIYILNDWTDIESDKISEPERPLITGKVSPREAITSSIVFTILGTLLSLSIKPKTCLVFLVYIALGVIYSVPPIRIKSRPFGKQICISGGFFLSILAGGATMNSYPPVLLFTGFAISFFALIGSTTADLKDMEADKRTGCKSMALLLGPEKTIGLTISAFIFMMSLTIYGYYFFGLNIAYVIITLVISGLNLKNFWEVRGEGGSRKKFKKADVIGRLSIIPFTFSFLIGLI